MTNPPPSSTDIVIHQSSIHWQTKLTLSPANDQTTTKIQWYCHPPMINPSPKINWHSNQPMLNPPPSSIDSVTYQCSIHPQVPLTVSPTNAQSTKFHWQCHLPMLNPPSSTDSVTYQCSIHHKFYWQCHLPMLNPPSSTDSVTYQCSIHHQVPLTVSPTNAQSTTKFHWQCHLPMLNPPQVLLTVSPTNAQSTTKFHWQCHSLMLNPPSSSTDTVSSHKLVDKPLSSNDTVTLHNHQIIQFQRRSNPIKSPNHTFPT